MRLFCSIFALCLVLGCGSDESGQSSFGGDTGPPDVSSGPFDAGPNDAQMADQTLPLDAGT